MTTHSSFKRPRFISQFPVLLGIVAVFMIVLVVIIRYSENQMTNYIVGRVLESQAMPEFSEGIGEIRDAYRLKVRLERGPYKGLEVTLKHFNLEEDLYNIKINTGDRVMVFLDDEEQPRVRPELEMSGIDSLYKTHLLMILTAVFVISVVVVTGASGLKSLISLLITLVIIFGFSTRALLWGYSPILIAVLTSMVVTAVTLAIVAGWNKKSLAAVIGTVGGVTTAGLLAYLSTRLMHLSGFVGHETLYLRNVAGFIDVQGLLVCGMIIGSLGAVMDVCISIASAMWELHLTDHKLSPAALMNSGLKIGRDIIGTMTNTLVLAYAGSSFTLILLFISQRAEFPLGRILNMDFITSEIVRSLAGSMGMVLAIPLTAVSSALLFSSPRYNNRTDRTDRTVTNL